MVFSLFHVLFGIYNVNLREEVILGHEISDNSLIYSFFFLVYSLLLPSSTVSKRKIHEIHWFDTIYSIYVDEHYESTRCRRGIDRGPFLSQNICSN